VVDNPVVEMLPDDSGRIVPHVKHFVRPDIEYLKPNQNVTPRQIKQGWIQRIFQGRQAIERALCIDCLNANYIRAQLNAEQRAKAKKQEEMQGAEENFYLSLCDMDGNY
jgi:hypothetical protein